MKFDEFLHHATRSLAAMKGRRESPDADERAKTDGIVEYAQERGFPGFLEEFETEVRKSRAHG